MNDKRMTAEERVRRAVLGTAGSDVYERLDAIAREIERQPVELPLPDAIRIAEEHAAAETEELRAEVERLKNELRSTRIDHIGWVPSEAVDIMQCERDEARAEVERLRGVVYALHHEIIDDASPLLGTYDEHLRACPDCAAHRAEEKMP